jgi:hypothetical protein
MTRTVLAAIIVVATVGSAFAGACSDCINQCCEASGNACSTSIGRGLCQQSCVDFDKVCFNTKVTLFESTGVVSADGRHLSVTGLFNCPIGIRIQELRATITQGVGGAVAEGREHAGCTGVIQSLPVKANAQGQASFLPGPAEVCGLVTIANGGDTTDAEQWCKGITLQLQ